MLPVTVAMRALTASLIITKTPPAPENMKGQVLHVTDFSSMSLDR